MDDLISDGVGRKEFEAQPQRLNSVHFVKERICSLYCVKKLDNSIEKLQKKLVSGRFWCPKIHQDTYYYVKSCDGCEEANLYHHIEKRQILH